MWATHITKETNLQNCSQQYIFFFLRRFALIEDIFLKKKKKKKLLALKETPDRTANVFGQWQPY